MKLFKDKNLLGGSQSLAHIDTEQSDKNIRVIIAFLEKNKLDKSTRVWRLINKCNSHKNDKSYALSYDSVYFELDIIYEIISVLGDKYSKLIARHLKSGKSDNVTEGNQQSRNHQFELFVASRYTRAGFDVQIGEPDLYFFYQQSRYNIACKRIMSERRIIDNIKEACHQIARQEGCGIVCIDLTLMLMKRKLAPKTSLAGLRDVGLDIIWKEVLSNNVKKISLAVRKRAALVQAFASMSAPVNCMLAHGQFDYAMKIKGGCSAKYQIDEIRQAVQNLEPLTAKALTNRTKYGKP